MIAVASVPSMAAMTGVPTVTHGVVIHVVVRRVLVVLVAGVIVTGRGGRFVVMMRMVRRAVVVMIVRSVIVIGVRFVTVPTGNIALSQYLARRRQGTRGGHEPLRIGVEPRAAACAAEPVALTVEVAVEAGRLSIFFHHDVPRHNGADREGVIRCVECSGGCVVMFVWHGSSIPIGGLPIYYTPGWYWCEA